MIFRFKGLIFQVLATSFRFAGEKRGRTIEKLVGDDAIGVQGEG